MNHIAFVEIVDCFKHLTNSLGRVLFGEFPLFADTIEQFAAGRKLSNNIPFILRELAIHSSLTCAQLLSNLGFKPLIEFNDMRVLHP